MIACLIAGSVEMEEGTNTDPKLFFAGYAVLIFILLIAAINLNKDCEPEIVLQIRKREEKQAKKKEALVSELGLELLS